MDLRPALTPPALDAAQVRRLTELAREIATGAEAGSPTRELVVRFNADAGAHVTVKDLHGAAGAGGLRDLVERVLTPSAIVADLTDQEAAELVRRIRAAADPPRTIYFWRSLLEKSLGQPGMGDLLDYPNQEMSAELVVTVARTCWGASLARYLDPICAGYHVARGLLRALAKKRLIVLRTGASLDELARGAGQFLSRPRPSSKQLSDLGAWLVAQPAVEELFADDDQLSALLEQRT